MRLTYPTALVLQALLDGRHHGFDIMDATGLPSGTVYPILRRLDAEGYVRSRWEKEGVARKEQRPAAALLRADRRRAARMAARGRGTGARPWPPRARACCGRSKARARCASADRSRAPPDRPGRAAWCQRACATTGAANGTAELASVPTTPTPRLVRHALGRLRRCVLDPPARRRRSPDHRRSASRLPPVAPAVRLRRHRRRHPRAQHGRVGHRLQRGLADPAAAAALRRARTHRHACGSASPPTPGRLRRRARQLPRLARARHELHAARRRRALQLRLHRRRSAGGAQGHRCVTEGFFDVFGIAAAGRPVLHARGAQEGQQPRRGAERAVLAQRTSTPIPAIVGTAIPHRRRRVSWSPASRPTTSSRTSRSTSPGDRDLYAAKAIEEYEPRIRASGYWSVVGRLKDGVIDRAGAGRDGRDSPRRSRPRIRARTRTCAPRSSRCASTWSATCGRRSALFGGGGHRGAADCLRQRHQPAARARRGPPAGTGRAHRARRQPRTAGRPAAR